MKQFNLEEYKKNPSRQVVTRDEKNVRIICTDRQSTYPVVALIEGTMNERIESYTNDGLRFYGTTSPLDLFFASEKHKGWINIYKDDRGVLPGERIYNTEKEAEISICHTCSYVATIQIEWEE